MTQETQKSGFRHWWHRQTLPGKFGWFLFACFALAFVFGGQRDPEVVAPQMMLIIVLGIIDSHLRHKHRIASVKRPQTPQDSKSHDRPESS